MQCPKCGLNELYRNGTDMRRGGRVQKWRCMHCGHVFIVNDGGRGVDRRV